MSTGRASPGRRMDHRRHETVDRTRVGRTDVAVVWARTEDGCARVLGADGYARLHRNPDHGEAVHESERAVRHRARWRAGAGIRDSPDARGLSGPFGCLNEARFGIAWGAMGAARSALDAGISRARSARFLVRLSAHGSSFRSAWPTHSWSTRRGCLWHFISGDSGRRCTDAGTDQRRQAQQRA